jgi:hypothetical protein
MRKILLLSLCTSLLLFSYNLHAQTCEGYRDKKDYLPKVKIKFLDEMKLLDDKSASYELLADYVKGLEKRLKKAKDYYDKNCKK